MSFREPCHPDPEPATVWMSAGFVESANEFDQIDCVLKRVPRFVVCNSNRPVTPQCKNISDGSAGVSKNDRFDLLFIVSDASKVRDRVELRCLLNALDQIVSQIAR